MKKDDDLPPNHGTPRQSGSSGMVWLTNVVHGGMIPNGDVACRIAEILLEAHYGTAQVERQRPLVATDKGDYWRVDGSRPLTGKQEGLGPYFVSIKKYDGAVTDFGIYYDYVPHPAVRPLIEDAQRKQKPDETK